MATNSEVNTDLTLGEAAGRYLTLVKEQDKSVKNPRRLPADRW